MAEKTRLELLSELAAKDPENAFARYGLAMELGQAGRLDEAAAAFRALSQEHPAYVPTFYQAGKLLERMGRPGDARDFFQRGIDAASRAGNGHAREELEAALAMLD